MLEKRDSQYRQPHRNRPVTAAEVHTQLLQIHLLHAVDGGQRRDPALDASASVSGRLVNPLDHLLLPVDPVEPVSQDGQPHGLEDAGVLEDDAIGSWGEAAWR